MSKPLGADACTLIYLNEIKVRNNRPAARMPEVKHKKEFAKMRDKSESEYTGGNNCGGVLCGEVKPRNNGYDCGVRGVGHYFDGVA